jgi:hypothetical protein
MKGYFETMDEEDSITRNDRFYVQESLR